MSVTWNPLDKYASITLSGDDLVATILSDFGYRSLRGTTSKDAGKYYWEVTVTKQNASGTTVVAVADSSASLSARMGNDAHGWGYRANGQKITGGSSTSYGSSYGTGAVIGVALDMDAGKVWFSKDGVWQASGDPAAGTNEAFSGISGNIFPAGTVYDGDGSPEDSITANFGATEFTYTVPDGFSGLDTAQQASATDGATLGDSADGMSLTDSLSDGVGLGDAAEGQNNAGKYTEGVTLGDTAEGQRNADEYTEGAVLGDTSSTQATYEAPAVSDGAVLADSTDGVSLSGVISDAADLGDTAAGYAEVQRSQSDGAVFSDSSDGFNFSAWLAANRDKFTVHYECTLTGAEDGVADAELPMSSFQARMNTGVQYLSVIVPGATYASTINARSNGQLYVEKVAYLEGVESLRVEVCRVDLEGIRVDEGAKRASITLDGHGYKTFPSQTTALQAVTYRMSDSGTYTYRMAYPDWYMKPGFTATYDDNSITVSQVTINVNSNQAVMEVTNG